MAVEKTQSSDQPSPGPVPWSFPTPEKVVNPPRRTSCRRNAPRSLKQVKKAAKMLQKSGLWVNPPRRTSDGRIVLRSLKQVKEAAKMLQKSDQRPAVIPDPFSVAKSHYPKVLPEKYDLLDKFFKSLITSIRLLKMKGSMSTFTNIRPKIECLTDDRRFTYSHLAQLKFIFPEAIKIKKILVRDERTSCMKPDLHVTLNFNFNAVENDEKPNSDHASLKLMKLFRSRLLSFFEANPEVDEVPEDKLPEPFNLSSEVSSANLIKKPNLVSVHETATYALKQKQPVAVRGRFSKQAPSQNAVTLEQEPARVAPETAVLPLSKPLSDLSSMKEGFPSPSPVKWSSTLPETPIKSCDLKEKEDISAKGATTIDGTPSKLVLTPSSVTPAQAVARPPKRCFMTPDDDSMRSPSKFVRRSSGRRSITFDTPVKNEMATAERTSKLVLTPSSATPAQAVARPPKRCFMTPDDDSMKFPSKLVRRSSGRRSITFDTPVKNEMATAERTSKLVLTPSSATPTQAVAGPPKRCFMTPDDDSMKFPSKLVRRSSSRRSITFDTPVKNEMATAERTSSDNEIYDILPESLVSDDEIYDILPESLLESIKAKERETLEEKDLAISQLQIKAKESEALEEKNLAISQAKWRKLMIARLPRLFHSLLFLFQSINRSVIPKKELVYRLISCHSDIIDRREVEEQLRLLQELAPEWMHEKKTSSGVLLCCINKTSSPESIRARLAEAKQGKICSRQSSLEKLP